MLQKFKNQIKIKIPPETKESLIRVQELETLQHGLMPSGGKENQVLIMTDQGLKWKYVHINNGGIVTENNLIKSIAVGYNCVFVVRSDGLVWRSTGKTDFSTKFGGETFSGTNILSTISNVKQISCCAESTHFLKNDGTVWNCGRNYLKELGRGTGSTATDSLSLAQLTSINNVKEIFCGYYSTYCLKNDGTLWAYGQGNRSSGFAGIDNGTNAFGSEPIKVSLDNVKFVSSMSPATTATMMLLTNGDVWTCGDNIGGGMGFVGGTNGSKLTKNYSGMAKISMAYCGSLNGGTSQSSLYSYLLNTNGVAFNCGSNKYGELGRKVANGSASASNYGEVMSNVKDILCTSNSPSNRSGYFLKTDNSVWRTDGGQTTYTKPPIQILTNVKQMYGTGQGVGNVYFVKNDNTIWVITPSNESPVQVKEWTFNA
jgi:alpha-tubulin suppressor-like RCC1 family protein